MSVLSHFLVLSKKINGSESLSMSEISNLALCDIFVLIYQERYMLFTLPREIVYYYVY